MLDKTKLYRYDDHSAFTPALVTRTVMTIMMMIMIICMHISILLHHNFRGSLRICHINYMYIFVICMFAYRHLITYYNENAEAEY